MLIRFTKFPFVFYATNKGVETHFDTKKMEITKAELNSKEETFKIKAMEKWKFLLIKYIPIILFIAIFYNSYDIAFTKSKIISYIFALLLLLPMFIFNSQDIRRMSVLVVLFASVGAGFYIGDFNIPAFAIKYFILFFAIFMFIVDIQYRAFSVLDKNEKVITNFVLSKEEYEEIFTTKNKEVL